MTFDEVRQKMIDYYENVDFVDGWLNKRIPSLPFQNHSPREIFEMRNHRNAMAFLEDFAYWLDTMKAKL